MAEERRLAAIMFVDICGFSRIMGSNEELGLTIVDMATSVIESATDVYDGRIIKKLGDGFLAEFSSAVNAVQAALEVQRAVSRHNERSVEEHQFQLRIGIHVGDVVVADGDIFGDGVNVASRIEPLAEPGGICISRDVLDMIHNKIAIETVKLGPQDLKNISRKIDIYGVLVDAMSAGKTIRLHRKKKLKKVMKGALIGAGVLLVLLLVLAAVGGSGRRGHRKKAAEAFQRTESAARTAAEAGKFGEALEILRAYPKKFSETEFQQRINHMISALEKKALDKELRQRTEGFIEAVYSGNKDRAMAFIDPAVFRKIDASSMWLKLRMVSGLFKLAGGADDSIRIKDIDVADNMSNAMVFLEIQKRQASGGTAWESPPPWEWRNIDGEWLLHMEPPEGTESDDATTRRPLPGPIRRRPLR